MPAAKKPTRSPRPNRPASRPRSATQFKAPVALTRLSTSLDAAQEALAELRKDAGRDVDQGAREPYKDLRTFISSARRDSGKLARALRRDFEQAQKHLAEASRPARAAAQPRSRRTARSAEGAPRSRRPDTPARTSAKAGSGARSTTPAASRSPAPLAGATRSAILQALAGREAMTAGEIATATGLAPRTLSTTLSRMAKSGEIGKATRGYQLDRNTRDGR